MRRRDRKALESISRHLASEDPGLAAELSEPVDRIHRWARVVGKVLLALGIAFFVIGWLLVIDTLLGLGIILLLCFWLPAEITKPSQRGSQPGWPRRGNTSH